MLTYKRMDKPMANLAKRQAAYAGEIMHDFHEIPGNTLVYVPIS